MAVGIGVTLLLHCDLVYAADTATFQLPFVNLGLVPEAGSSLLLPRLVGHQRASELMLLGERFTAAVALDLGFVNRVLPLGEFPGTVRDVALSLASKPGRAVRMTKALLKGTRDELSRRIAEEGALFDKQLGSPEAAEAMAAFRERRKPDFSAFA
jgi:enoyl-CoA hydratase/carnithine racemase